MRTRIVIPTALAAVLACNAAHAEEWLSLSKTSDSHPTEILLDLSSITVKKNIRTAQTKHRPLLPWADGTQPPGGVAFGLQNMSFNCKSALARTGSVDFTIPMADWGGLTSYHRGSPWTMSSPRRCCTWFARPNIQSPSRNHQSRTSLVSSLA